MEYLWIGYDLKYRQQSSKYKQYLYVLPPKRNNTPRATRLFRPNVMLPLLAPGGKTI